MFHHCIMGARSCFASVFDPRYLDMFVQWMEITNQGRQSVYAWSIVRGIGDAWGGCEMLDDGSHKTFFTS